MNLCDKCSKNITKRSPGLECSKCEKVVHSNTSCSGLTNKQIAALRAAENLDWTCQECHNSSFRRSSFFIPEENEDEGTSQDSAEVSKNVKQLLKEMTKEMEKAIQREMKDFMKSLQYQSDKMDEIMENIEFCKQSIQELKRKNTELMNKNSNLETRINALEQRQHEIEQQKLNNQLEVFNIPTSDDKEIKIIAENIAKKLHMPCEDIVSVQVNSSTRKENTGTIQIKMKNTETLHKWLSVSKSTKILVKDIIVNESEKSCSKTVFLKESLTPYNKKLLWNAKQKLKDVYKFIWCKRGIIRVRKNSDSEQIILRSLEDINKLI